MITETKSTKSIKPDPKIGVQRKSQPVKLSEYAKGTSYGSALVPKAAVKPSSSSTPRRNSADSTTQKSNKPTSAAATTTALAVSSNIPQQKTNGYDFHADISSQLQFYCRHKPINPLSALCTTKDLYCLQARYLSRYAMRTLHPRSVAYQVISKDIRGTQLQQQAPLRQREHTTPSSTAKPLVGTHQHNSVTVKLKNAFSRLVNTYERHFQQRLSRTSSSQLTPTDKEEVLALWLKGRKLIEMYEHYCYRAKQQQYKQRQPPAGAEVDEVFRCRCEVCAANDRRDADLSELVSTLIRAMPLHTPIAVPRSSASAVDTAISSSSSKQPSSSGSFGYNQHSAQKPAKLVTAADSDQAVQRWHSSSRSNVAEFHETFQRRVKYVIESAVGQRELDRSVRQLKTCVEHKLQLQQQQAQLVSRSGGGLSRDVVARSEEAQRGEWRAALQEYKAVYCLLVEEARDNSRVVFLHREQHQQEEER